MKNPAFQFYPSDFLSDSKVVRMSNSEVGMYWLLLCYAWMDNGLPTDMQELADLAREPRETFETVWTERLKRCFFERDGRLFNKRQEEIREEQRVFREAKAAAGRAGGIARAILSANSHLDNTDVGTPLANPSTALADSSTAKEIASKDIAVLDKKLAEPAFANEKASRPLAKASPISPTPSITPNIVSGETIAPPRRRRVRHEFPVVDFGDLETDIAAYFALIAQTRQSGTLDGYFVLRIRHELFALRAELANDQAFLHGLRVTGAKAIDNIRYVRQVALGYKPSPQLALAPSTARIRHGWVRDRESGLYSAWSGPKGTEPIGFTDMEPAAELVAS